MPKQASKKSNRLTFPVRLHGLLTQAPKFGLDNIISWDVDGTKFIIYHQKELENRVLPNFFKQSTFASFRRQLNAYGFERAFLHSSKLVGPKRSVGDNRVLISYTREDFRRDEPSACERISRQYSNHTMNKSSSSSLTRPIHEDAAPMSDENENSIICAVPSLVPSWKGESARTTKQKCESTPESLLLLLEQTTTTSNASYMPELELNELLSVFDNDTPFHNLCKSATMISWDPSTESLTC